MGCQENRLTFWAQVDHENEWKSRYHRRPKLKPPGDVARVHDSQVCGEAEEDTNGNPELPGHGQGASD